MDELHIGYVPHCSRSTWVCAYILTISFNTASNIIRVGYKSFGLTEARLFRTNKCFDFMQSSC